MTGISNVMVRNSVDSNVAFRAAEAGMQIAEAVVENETSLAAYEANANGKYEAHAVGETPRWENDATWDGINSVAVDYSDGYSQPLYMIEFIRTIVTDEDTLNLDNVGGGTGEDRIQIFRITSLGTGKTESTKVLLQSMYGKKF